VTKQLILIWSVWQYYCKVKKNKLRQYLRYHADLIPHLGTSREMVRVQYAMPPQIPIQAVSITASLQVGIALDLPHHGTEMHG